MTGVFAMPYSGLCPNAGRLDISQQQVRPRTFQAAFTPQPSPPGLRRERTLPREHRLERAIVELNDEGEHQVEQVAVLSREVEAKNVTDQRQISMRRRDRADIDMNIPASTP